MEHGNMFFEEQSINREEAVRNTMVGVYGWMTLALLVTAFTSFFVANNISMLVSVINAYWIFAIAEIAVVFFLSARAHRMSGTAAKVWFMVYAVLNGITLSSIFLVYNIGTIGNAFLVTAIVFGVTTVYGYVTKADLSKIGQILIVALFGLIIASIASIFMPAMDKIVTYAGVFIFIALVGYDTQKIKQYATVRNASILGALELYLDFINIFIRLLRIAARSND